jgi:hypothetical protein
MRRLAGLSCLLILGSCMPAFCVRVSWIRVLSGDADPVAWKEGQPWPERPDGFPFSPSTVLSYATLHPGEVLPLDDVRQKARAWARELEESRRFSRSSVLVTALGENPDRCGVIVEAETGAVPLFDGGPDYGSMALPLLGGRRATLAFAAGANVDSVAYRDEALGGKPWVLDSRASYSNDLLDSGDFSGNRLVGSMGVGPRLGPLSDILFRARADAPLDAGSEDSKAFSALEVALELGGFSLLKVDKLDASLIALGDVYLGASALKLEVVSNLQYEFGPATLSLAAAAGSVSDHVDPGELFELRFGEPYLRGPESFPYSTSRFALSRIDVDCKLLGFPVLPWLRLSLGPFAFCEAVAAPSDTASFRPLNAGIPLEGAAGAGLRLRLGAPVGITMDIGYAMSDRGEGTLVFDVFSINPLLGEDLR